MGPSRSSTAHLDGLGTFSLDRIKSWLPGFHRAMSLHPSRCNGYVRAHANKPARHSRMQRAVLIAALCLVAVPQPATAAPDALPNLLVVITDDQAAANTLEVMPPTRRRIGRQGVTFQEAHVTTPKCCPSRASFFTGRYVHNHGVVSNGHASRLPHDQTVHYLLQKEGYRTAIFGKFLNSWPVEIDPPFFDEWSISNGGFEEGYWNIN